jgi:CRISPR-associated endonuclease/helicase Cas3
MFCAHSANSLGSRHELVAHLRGVAALAREFAGGLGAPDPAYYLGLWHDLGKFSRAFQDYLAACEADPDRRGRGPDQDQGRQDRLAERAPLAASHASPHTE